LQKARASELTAKRTTQQQQSQRQAGNSMPPAMGLSSDNCKGALSVKWLFGGKVFSQAENEEGGRRNTTSQLSSCSITDCQLLFRADFQYGLGDI